MVIQFGIEPECASTSGTDTRVAPPTQPDHGTQLLPAETTDLERRVLAHERILRTLVAHMTETEPRFLARLSETFIVPMQMARREHDYKDTDSYAEEFIRAIVHVMETSARKTSPAVTTLPLTNPLATPELDGPRHSLSPTRLQIHERSGVWEVTVDGRFYGHYLKKEHALAAIIAMA